MQAKELLSSLEDIYEHIVDFMNDYSDGLDAHAAPLSLESLASYSSLYKQLYLYNSCLYSDSHIVEQKHKYTQSVYSVNTDINSINHIYTDNILIGYCKLLLLFLSQEMESISVYNNPISAVGRPIVCSVGSSMICR